MLLPLLIPGVKRTFIGGSDKWTCELHDRKTHEHFEGEGVTKQAAYKQAKEKWVNANADRFDVVGANSSDGAGCLLTLTIILCGVIIPLVY